MSTSPVDARGPDPLFAQIARRLRADVAEGRLATGQRLAPERELCRRFSVSRNTLRRALGELENEGVLTADGRRGWSIAAPPVVETAQGPLSLTQWAREAGLSLESRVLGAQVRPATAAEAAALEIEPDAPVFELERVRVVDGAALSLDRVCIPGAFAPALHGVDFATASLYETLAERAGVAPGRRECTLRATAADARTARLLDVARGSPLLEVVELVRDRRGAPLEFSRLVNRGDRWRYRSSQISPEVASD